MHNALRLSSFALPLCAVTLICAAASAQISPRVVVLFDTSGSMLWDNNGVGTRGDGSVAQPGSDTNGDGIANDSKMFIAKEAVRDILIESGADIEFGLMRFHQREGANILPSEPTRYRSAINYTGWFSCDTNEGGADVLVNVGPNSRSAILSWMDGVESFPNQKELRGTGWTPLALSLQDAREHFSAEVIRNDPQSACRSYVVIMITDGVQECPEGTPERDPVAATAALRALGVQGRNFDVKTYVVGFGPNVNGAAQLNLMARAGGTAINSQGAIDLVAGNALFATNRQRLREVLADVLVAIEPVELCDGRDNDCDGATDEDFSTLGGSCSAGVGTCRRQGQLVCSDSGTSVQCNAQPGQRGAESCDGDDDDCDGEIDEGTFNACGACGAIPTEVCNGRDDNCNGQTDEGVLNACGACGAAPRELCNGLDDDCDDRFDEGLLNDCGECGPTPREVCDGLDNDCDDLIDEGFDAQCGDCTPTGAELCDGRDNDCDAIVDEGVRNDCNACGALPAELCNDLDDDCDGQLDEGVRNRCGQCGPEPAELCNFADDNCDGQIDEGAENACRYCGPLRREACDNVDNDCNGAVDDDVVCPIEGEVCVNGECAERCQAGECFLGRVCREGVCVLPCNNAECPSGFVCHDGFCDDPCVGIECRPGLICSLGRCIEEDCYVAGCPGGQVCVGGACLDDPCAEVDCGPTQGCRDGGCFDTCLGVTCPDGQRCERGVCFSDNCAGRDCPADRICEDGRCVSDPCAEVICEPGLACFDGDCADDPCLRTTCPDGTTCRLGDCIPDDDDGGQVDAGEGEDGPGDLDPGEPDGLFGTVPTGPEACSCATPARPAPRSRGLLALAALAMLAGLVRARRRR